MTSFRPARVAATLGLLMLWAACSGDSKGPTEPKQPQTVTQEIEIPNIFAGQVLSASAGGFSFSPLPLSVEIRKIRLTVYEVASGKVLFQNVYDVDPNATRWKVPFTAPVGVSIRLVSELISVSAGVEKVEYSGQAGPLTLSPCTSGCAPIPIQNHPGPVENLGATAISVSPSAASLAEGGVDTMRLRATITPAGTYQPYWKSLDPMVAAVGADGLVTAMVAGTARIVVGVNSRTDTATITVAVGKRAVQHASAESQTAPVGTPVAVPPSVVVRTLNGLGVPAAGAVVVFEIVSGGGAVTGGTVTANASGVATVGGWTLGATAGSNQLRARLATGEFVTFTATGNAGAPHAIAVVAGQGQTAAAGSTVAVPPSVRVSDANGNSVAGATVDFSVESGGGTVSGGEQTTNADGVATVGGWTLGAAGVNTLRAAVRGTSLTASITATGTLASPTQIAVHAGAGQSAPVGTTLPIAPAVVLRDASNTPVANVAVTFEVTSGGGSITGASATTNAQGVAAVGSWTLGATVGAQTLTARAGSLSAVVTATATAVSTCVSGSHSVGATVTGSWSAGDCRDGSRLYDKYEFTVTQQTAVRGILSSTATSKSLGIFSGGVEVLDWIRSSAGDLAATWFLAPGTYEMRVAAPDSASGATYTVATAATDGDIGCTSNSATGGVSFDNQSLGSGDCSFNGRFEDRVVLYVAAGKQISASMTASAFAPCVIIRDPFSQPGQFLARGCRSGGGTVSASTTASATGYYQVIFSTELQNASGGYSGGIGIQ